MHGDLSIACFVDASAPLCSTDGGDVRVPRWSMRPAINLVGRLFGRLTVIAREGSAGQAPRRPLWRCRCSCGIELVCGPHRFWPATRGHVGVCAPNSPAGRLLRRGLSAGLSARKFANERGQLVDRLGPPATPCAVRPPRSLEIPADRGLGATSSTRRKWSALRRGSPRCYRQAIASA
jgi:hypothetical protein